MKLMLRDIIKLDEAVEGPHLTEILNNCNIRVPAFKKATLAYEKIKTKISMKDFTESAAAEAKQMI